MLSRFKAVNGDYNFNKNNLSNMIHPKTITTFHIKTNI